MDPGTGVRFWLEYWNNNSATDPGSLSPTPTGTILSNDFYRNLQGDNSYADWTSVSPFMVDNNNLIIADSQPRWVKLYIDFYQPGFLSARVDSVNFTSKCIVVPEATTIALGFMGLSTVGGFSFLRSRK